MAQRGAWTPNKVRERIQTSMLINRLQDHALGKLEQPLTKDQVLAIQILLRKTLPDLSQTELSGAGGGPILTHELSDQELERIAGTGRK